MEEKCARMIYYCAGLQTLLRCVNCLGVKPSQNFTKLKWDFFYNIVLGIEKELIIKNSIKITKQKIPIKN